MSPREPSDTDPRTTQFDRLSTSTSASDSGAGANSSAEGDVPIEVSVDAAADEGPPVESDTRIDILVDAEAYPTARLSDGRYVAWWFSADAPPADAPATSEWVTAPTRFLAAGTLHELWADPSRFDSIRAVDG